MQIETANRNQGRQNTRLRPAFVSGFIPDKFFTAVLKLLTTKKVLNNYMESTNGSYTLTKLTTFLLKSGYI